MRLEKESCYPGRIGIPHKSSFSFLKRVGLVSFWRSSGREPPRPEKKTSTTLLICIDQGQAAAASNFGGQNSVDEKGDSESGVEGSVINLRKEIRKAHWPTPAERRPVQLMKQSYFGSHPARSTFRATLAWIHSRARASCAGMEKCHAKENLDFRSQVSRVGFYDKDQSKDRKTGLGGVFPYAPWRHALENCMQDCGARPVAITAVRRKMIQPVIAISHGKGAKRVLEQEHLYSG